MQSRSLWLTVVLGATTALGACAARPVAVAIAPPPPVVATVVPMPAGAYAGMIIPSRLPDGTYATPNRALSEVATTWHLRAGLNVAALACRGPDEAVVTARYNAMLARQRGVLRDAEARLASEYRVGGDANWRSRYDAEMTSLYNFFSQSFVRDAFCSTSARILAESETVDPAAFPAFAAARLPLLDAAFADFYRRYDAWRTQNAEQPLGSPVGSGAPRIELGPVAGLPQPDGRDVVWSPKPMQLASAQPSR